MLGKCVCVWILCNDYFFVSQFCVFPSHRLYVYVLLGCLMRGGYNVFTIYMQFYMGLCYVYVCFDVCEHIIYDILCNQE